VTDPDLSREHSAASLPALSRRRTLALGAVGGLSLPLLAACGGGSSAGGAAKDTGGQSSSDKSQSSSATSGADALVATKDVPVGGGVILADQNVVVTQPQKGTFAGFSATCTHEGCLLATVASGTINCCCHGSQFNITDGANVAGPSGSPAGSVAALPKVGITVKGAEVLKT
jgi:nitrite reductase/ring-hydroxylating ferredoxin subunit